MTLPLQLRKPQIFQGLAQQCEGKPISLENLKERLSKNFQVDLPSWPLVYPLHIGPFKVRLVVEDYKPEISCLVSNRNTTVLATINLPVLMRAFATPVRLIAHVTLDNQGKRILLTGGAMGPHYFEIKEQWLRLRNWQFLERWSPAIVRRNSCSNSEFQNAYVEYTRIEDGIYQSIRYHGAWSSANPVSFQRNFAIKDFIIKNRHYDSVQKLPDGSMGPVVFRNFPMTYALKMATSIDLNI